MFSVVETVDIKATAQIPTQKGRRLCRAGLVGTYTDHAGPTPANGLTAFGVFKEPRGVAIHDESAAIVFIEHGSDVAKALFEHAL